MGRFFVIWYFLCLVFTAFADEPLKVYATVDRNQMSIGDTFTLKVTITSSGTLAAGAPSLPALDDFDMLNTWSSRESRSVLTNGRFEVNQSRVFNYMLAPKKSGQLKIEGATVIAGDKTYVTKPITITVSKSTGVSPRAGGRQRSRPAPQDPFAAMEDAFSRLLERSADPGFQSQPVNPDEAFFIQVAVDKTDVVVGEQVTASWYIYTRGQIRDIDTLKYPSLNGFWKEEIHLATRLNFQTEIVNGVPYQKALLASFALFPIKEGVAKVDPYKAKCTVIRPSRFGFGRPFQTTKISKTVKVNVKPLPVENMPSDFNGAVGTYSVRSSLDTQSTEVNQPVTLKVRFEGKGNAKLIDLPSLSLPESFEEYDTKVSSKYFKDGRSFKEFEVLMIPREPGQFVVPPVSLSMFNPEKGEYYQMQTQEHPVEILPGQGQEVIASSPLSTTPSENKGGDSPALLLTKIAGASQSSWTNRLVTWAGLYFLSFSLLFWRVYREFGWGKAEKTLEEALKKRMLVVRSCLKQGDYRGVGVNGMNCLYSVLGEVSGQGGANQELEKLLAKAPPSVRRDLSEEFRALLNEFETLSFAPEGVIGELNETQRLKTMVSRLDRVLQRSLQFASVDINERIDK